MALSGVAVVHSVESEYAAIGGWYRDLLERSYPPVGLLWEPVKIGPTWQWDDGWLLPEHSLGWHVLAWCGVWLQDAKGQPWQFTAEQARFVLWFYAIDESGEFLYHSSVLQRMKGWGKDPMAACLASAALFADVTFDHWAHGEPVGRPESAAWVQIIAVSQDQTKNTMKLFPSLISPDARRQYGIQIGKLNVWGMGDTRQIQAVTSSYLSIEGARPTLIIRNETQNWNTSNGGHDMAGAIEGNATKRDHGTARMLDICNAYRPGEDSVGQRAREGWDRVDAGEIAEFGVMYDSLEAPDSAPLTIDAAPSVVEAIRGDAVWLNTKRIVASIANPANPPSESRRKWYNQIRAAEDALIDPGAWKDLPKATPLIEGEEIVMFFDGSKSDDASGLVGCRISDGAVFMLGIWERPAQWNREIDGIWNVNRDDVDMRVNEVFETYKVIGFWADPSDTRDETGERYWEALIDEWHRRFKKRLKLWATKTGDKQHAVSWDMRAPVRQAVFCGGVERFVTDVEDGSLIHDHNGRLRLHVIQSKRRPNTKYGLGMGKENRESAKKIDLAVCAVGARLMWRQVLNTQKPKSEGTGRLIWLN